MDSDVGVPKVTHVHPQFLCALVIWAKSTTGVILDRVLLQRSKNQCLVVQKLCSCVYSGIIQNMSDVVHMSECVGESKIYSFLNQAPFHANLNTCDTPASQNDTTYNSEEKHFHGNTHHHITRAVHEGSIHQSSTLDRPACPVAALVWVTVSAT